MPAARRVALALVAILFALSPAAALACACGCGVFDVGAGSLLQTHPGGLAYVEYDFMNQNQNWSGSSSAPAANNDDKQIKTDFITFGGQYMFNHDWGVMAQIPVWSRLFRTENDAGTGVVGYNHDALSDIRVMGVYSGFSKTMSTAVTFGLKLPTGDWHYPGFDRDTEIGTGSWDLLLGGYHVGNITRDKKWTWSIQAQADAPLAGQGGYLPGTEVDASAGVSYNGFNLADGKVTIAPILQLIGSVRGQDSGVNADPPNSGYNRLLISPGVDIAVGAWQFYGDVELPLYRYNNGNQLVAPALFKVIVSRNF